MANLQNKSIIEKINWRQARASMQAVNPALTAIIDEIDPADKFALYKMTVPWGKYLLKQGSPYFPNADGDMVSIHDSDLDSALKQDFSYTQALPLGIILRNNAESFVYSDQYLVPYRVIQPGGYLGLWSSFLREPYYYGWRIDIVSGARSLLLMPKITDNTCFEQLAKEFDLRGVLPQTLLEQWPLFGELANHPAFPEPWSMEVLYFSKAWLDALDDPAWLAFKLFFMNQTLQTQNFLRTQAMLNIFFSCAAVRMDLRLTAYLANTAKHLLMQAQGLFPGFQIANQSSSAPIDGFEQVFDAIYNTRYAPTLMQAGYLQEDKPLYYSLEVPTLIDFLPKVRKIRNKLDDLREIKEALSDIASYSHLHQDKDHQEALNELFNHRRFGYYHSDPDRYGEILPAKQLLEGDVDMQKRQKRFVSKPFCETSPLLRGCIKIDKI